jgi:molecular chaperone GrpE
MLDTHEPNDEHEMVPEDEFMPETVDIDPTEEEALTKDKIKALRDKLTACEEEKQKHHEDLQRARADFLNSRRRLEEQLSRDRERAGDSILIELLTLADSFDTAMADTETWNTVDERWKSGIEAIRANLMSILKRNNIELIDPEGLPFDPAEHEAVSNVTVGDDTQVHKVMSVLQKGYKRNGTVLRPARVTVGVKE